LCFRDPDGKDRGDCLRAAVGSLLEVDPATIPHFVQIEEDGGEYWWDGLQRWLGERGLWIASVPWHEVAYQAPASALTLATGVSPRDPLGKMKHMVVYRGCIFKGGAIAHDPHPDGTGLANEVEHWGFYAVLPLDPMSALR
jgi:hypothetical protein